MSGQSGWIACALFFATALHSGAARADIFRWDNGPLIPGTEDLGLGTGVQLDNRNLEFADLSKWEATSDYPSLQWS